MGYCYFPPQISFQVGPYRPTSGGVHWGHALVSSALLWQGAMETEREREREGGKRSRGKEGNRKAPVVPPCPNLSQGDTLTSRHSATLPRRRRKASLRLRMGPLGAEGTCRRRLLNQAAGETDVTAPSPGLRGRSRSSAPPRILCLRSRWSGTTLPGPTELARTNPPVCTSEPKELSPEESNSVCSAGRPQEMTN